ncbi:hypothetical protein DU002_11785 [Corallincola holothuriorum]|uniref:Uncharacterized protein n=1 Tax=Corallincola holothuriorum TaxID=2282215 RepID=A0A368NHJ0_9GAMM|nr:hypothetical protein [Corallincola holothuriorum]RCU49590.1 hypothetical protein DU002_11785 [Corallincola holothuriorum]
MNRSIERLASWFNRFLTEDAEHNKEQLERVKKKLNKLKRKSHMLQQLIDETNDEQEKETLQSELKIAKAIRIKAQQKYKALKTEMQDKKSSKE